MISEKRLLEKLRKACARPNNKNRWAKEHGVHYADVYNALYGKKRIKDNIAAALGYRRVGMWEKVKRKPKK